MNRTFFFIATLFLGILLHVFCEWYLSFFQNIGPQILLLLVLAHGFLCGSLTAETLGFAWGLAADAMGVSLFGMNALLLPLAGYVAGKLRRRVASERPAAQVAIALFGSIVYGIGVNILLDMFEPDVTRSTVAMIAISGVLNVLLVTAVFWAVERWIDLWGLPTEQA